jgi:hypothetical protein
MNPDVHTDARSAHRTAKVSVSAKGAIGRRRGGTTAHSANEGPPAVWNGDGRASGKLFDDRFLHCDLLGEESTARNRDRNSEYKRPGEKIYPAEHFRNLRPHGGKGRAGMTLPNDIARRLVIS